MSLENPKPAVHLENVYKIFLNGGKENRTVALNGISIDIETGSFTVVGGANGSGKSVLMEIIAGLIVATKGKVETSSKPGLIFQDASAQILGDTPREDVGVGPENLGMKKKDVALKVEESLKKVSLLEKADLSAESLSGGEKRRLAVASILAMDRDIMIFDEPYANLDYPGVKDVNRLLKELHENGKTIILLTHELEKCLGMADHFIVLAKGEKLFDGKPEDALSMDMEEWGIRNPLVSYSDLRSLVW